jgi:hypothetical protein
VKLFWKFLRVGQKKIGAAGYRSRYLSHAKRALYHLSYSPVKLLSFELIKDQPVYCHDIY